MAAGVGGPVATVVLAELAALVVDEVAIEARIVAAEVVVLLTVALLILYMLRRSGPPQYSVWLLLHAMLQSVAGALTAPGASDWPQKHWPPYSTPA